MAVDEEGTEAGGDGDVDADRGRPVEFTADHPFMFVIRESATGAILFVGRLV